jgi:hypothetical protein
VTLAAVRDSFVEESNLSQSIFLLRKALGETAQDHRYIVTIPGRGYRFAEKVEEISEEIGDLVVESRSQSRVTIEEENLSGRVPALSAVGRSVRFWKWVLPAAAVVSGLAVGAYLYFHHAPVLTGRTRSSSPSLEIRRVTRSLMARFTRAWCRAVLKRVHAHFRCRLDEFAMLGL